MQIVKFFRLLIIRGEINPMLYIIAKKEEHFSELIMSRFWDFAVVVVVVITRVTMSNNRLSCMLHF